MTKSGSIPGSGATPTHTPAPDVEGKIGLEASRIFDLGANVVIGVQDVYVRIPAEVAEQVRANAPMGKILSNAVKISGDHLRPMPEAARMQLIFLAGTGANVAQFYEFVGLASDLALASITSPHDKG